VKLSLAEPKSEKPEDTGRHHAQDLQSSSEALFSRFGHARLQDRQLWQAGI
jgi:hypothetical protein